MSNLHLFTACVAIWGTTWIAITFQLGKVAPDVSVFYRFLLASLLVFVYCRWRRLPLGYTRRQHAWIALFGVLMFGVSYIFVYYAEQHADFVVPQTTDALTGVPEAGLTNAQAWAKYGQAIAGSVAPAAATTRAGIDGLVLDI